jgi:hypothetical protein
MPVVVSCILVRTDVGSVEAVAFSPPDSALVEFVNI